MSHEPKRRHSRERKGERRASIKIAVTQPINCLNCGNLTQSHKVCMFCGFYKGKEVVQRSRATK